mgnify:FL=1|jgi:hypothetical protein
MSNWHGGKGSKQRPSDTKKYQDNWDTIFGKKDKPSAVDDCATTKEESAANQVEKRNQKND